MASKRTPADRRRAADVRDWAAANDLQIAERGRIPAAVEAAYDAAMAAGDGPDEPGPDWSAAGADLVDLDEPPGEALPPGAAAGSSPGRAPGPGAMPPPPASLDDARERLTRSHAPRVPSWAGGGRGGGATQHPAAAPVKIPAKLIGDIEGKLALLAAVPAAGFEAVDPYCGGAVADAIPAAVKAAAPLIAQSETAVRWLTEGQIYFLWLTLAQALAPVGAAVWRHHVSHTVMIVDGKAVPARRLDNGQVVPAADVPPEPAPDWSGYGTFVPGHVPPVRQVAGQ